MIAAHWVANHWGCSQELLLGTVSIIFLLIPVLSSTSILTPFDTEFLTQAHPFLHWDGIVGYLTLLEAYCSWVGNHSGHNLHTRG